MSPNPPAADDGEKADAVRPVIAVERLTRAFGDHVAVREVSFAVLPGGIFGLIGPNGAGKSTLVKMLTTMLPPSSGGARIDGLDIVRDAQRVRARIGYVPQLLSADGALTAYENLLLSARLYLIPRREREARIATALREMGLEEARDRQVQTYSGGMIRRLEIAQSMLHNPAVLFMDEPTVGLDPIARHGVWDRVRALRERFGTTMLLTTHLMDEADALCDRIGVLHAGALEAVGTPAELKARVGPEATLDDVFAAIAGGQIADEGSFRSVREERRAERAHG
jgi:ABC-2 type transport system ATP-binding protein